MRRPHKYHAIATEVDGIRFASKAEARRFQELRLLEKAGAVSGIELQPVYPLDVVCPWNGEVIQVGKYIADFRYRTGACVLVEDVKGGPTTAVYHLKKRMVEAQYGIQIVEIR